MKTDEIASALVKQLGQGNAWIGSVLVVANPLEEKFDAGEVEVCRDQVLRQLSQPAHVYTTAARCYEAMREHEYQSIVLNGTAGSGKTQAMKHILATFAHLSKSKDENTSLEDQIPFSIPLLEAYGNAKTKSSPNSSRFALMIQIEFHNFKIDNCVINTFLLEKSRIVARPKGETTFHIMHRILTQRHQSALQKVDQVRKDWSVLYKSMHMLHFSKDELSAIVDLLNAILYLSACKFGESSSKQDAACRVTNPIKTLYLAAPLLGFRHGHTSLQRALTTARTNLFGVTAAAKSNRDTLIKALYKNLFDFLVDRINTSLRSDLATTAHQKPSIAILDFFGFDQCTSTLEHLCINYSNERLLLAFTESTFNQKLQIEEGVPYIPYHYQDNSACIALLDSKPLSLFSLLEDECKLGSAARNDKYRNRISQIFGSKSSKKHSDFLVDQIQGEDKRPSYDFGIKHFFGLAKYDASNFVQTNRDNSSAISPALTALFRDHCKLDFVKNLILGHDNSQHSMCSLFQSQLDDLIEVLKSTQPHFICCIKSAKNSIDSSSTLDQITRLRLVQALEFQQTTGYSSHMSISNFASRYALIVQEALRNLRRRRHHRQKDSSLKAICDIIMADSRLQDILEKEIDCPTSQVYLAVGKTRVFFKNEAVRHVLECLRIEAASFLLTRAQAHWRGALIRAAAAGTLLAKARDRHLAYRISWASALLQRWCRGAFARKWILRYRTAFYELLAKDQSSDIGEEVRESILDTALIPVFGHEHDDNGRAPKKLANLLVSSAIRTVRLPTKAVTKINEAIKDLKLLRSRRNLLQSVTHAIQAEEFRSVLADVTALGLDERPEVKWAKARFGKVIERADVLEKFQTFLDDPVAGCDSMDSLFIDADRLGLSTHDIVQQARDECQLMGGPSVLCARAALRKAVERVDADQIKTCLRALLTECNELPQKEIDGWPESRAAGAMQRMLDFETAALGSDQGKFALSENLIELCTRIEAASYDPIAQRRAETALHHAVSSRNVLDRVSRAYKWRSLFCEWLDDSNKLDANQGAGQNFFGMCINDARRAYRKSSGILLSSTALTNSTTVPPSCSRKDGTSPSASIHSFQTRSTPPPFKTPIRNAAFDLS